MKRDRTEQIKRIKFIRTVLLIVFAVCMVQIGRECYLAVEHRRQQEGLRDRKEGQGPAVEPENPAGQGQAVEPEGPAGQGQAVEPEGPAGQGQATEPEGPTGQGQAVGTEPPGREGDFDNGYGNDTSAKAKKTMEWRSVYYTAAAEGLFGRKTMLDKYAALYEENNDLAGWLTIEGTVIDYPVMQCQDDEYYLHHDYYGNDSKYGCLFVRDSADLQTPGTNFIIYGHNMRNGTMFGDLDLYQEESFCREHSIISFDTLYEERIYQVVAVFRSQVYDAEEDVFKYYHFYQADTQEEFDYFYENIKELSLYDTGITAEFGDTFLTLSTCAYHVPDGRFVVVARRSVH